MSEPISQSLQNPVVEAVVDLECDLPPGFQLAALEAPAREVFSERYPVCRTQFLQQHTLETKSEAGVQYSVKHGIQAFQFHSTDEKEIVQVRNTGYSFNRLAPYDSLSAYLPEVERTWRLFTALVRPEQVRTVRLRHLNRLPLPSPAGRVNLDEYFRVAPHLPDEENLTFTGFLNQHTAVEAGTGHVVNTVLTTQPPEKGTLPVIFDNCVEAHVAVEPENWPWILEKIVALRALSYRIFTNTLTPKCLSQFQLP